MQEYKFRGKSLLTGKWIYGSLIVNQSNQSFIATFDAVYSVANYKNGVTVTERCFHQVDPKTIGQYTGLLDKDGEEIYGGDICDFIILSGEKKYRPKESFLYIIEWQNACWGFKPLYPEFVHPDDRRWCSFWRDCNNEFWDLEYFKKIGNIHDNPDLLKLEQENHV